MKKTAFTILSLFIFIVAYSQTFIEKPAIGFSTAPYANITKIEASDTATILYFHTTYRSGNWISIPKHTYIQQVNGHEKLYIKSAEGIPLEERFTIPESGEISYKLIFPPIDKAANKFDYGEDNDGGTWFIYDIQIKPLVKISKLPQDLSGNWFNKSTGNWEISFFDTLVVYKNQLWNYDDIKLKNGQGSLKLKNKTTTIELFVKDIKSGNCRLGESPKDLRGYCNNIDGLDKRIQIADKPYELPVFKIDSATYSGYFKGYTTRIGVKTMSISIDDIITGKQNSFLIKIDENGFFSVKVPMYYPHFTWVRSSIYNGSVFLEPGKELFQMIDPSNPENTSLFMGESAKINIGLLKLDNVFSFDYNDMQRVILDMTPFTYKDYCQNLQKKDLKTLDSIMKTNTLCPKAYQVKKFDIIYSYASKILEYKWNFENAYRAKNNVSNTQHALPVKNAPLIAEYYNFITNEFANNSLVILCSSYNTFINHFKYLDILQSDGHKGFETLEIVNELQKSGYIFTESEKIVVEKMKELELLRNLPEQKEFDGKYLNQIIDIYQKYQDVLQSLFKKSLNTDIENYLIEKGIQPTDNEKLVFAAMKENDKKESSIKIKQFNLTYHDSINNFYKEHDSFINNMYTNKMKAIRIGNLKKEFGIEQGFASDIMTAQDNCRAIVEEITPVSDSELKILQQQITTPFIAEYIAICNQQTKAKLEGNKLKSGYVINEVPTTEADKLFESIMKKYKGKVVYVDFWATWCGPCRSGIEQIKPLKEEMAGENVAFVYITNPTSPQKTWSNMIPDIKGEHYRVSNDEWNYLAGKFNISGIPHYVLVGKNGEVLNPEVGHLRNEILKKELVKRINE